MLSSRGPTLKKKQTFGNRCTAFRQPEGRCRQYVEFGWADRNGAVYAIDQALEEMTKRYADASAAASADAFEAGRKLAYYETLDILRSRLMVFGGEMDEIDPPKCTGSIRK